MNKSVLLLTFAAFSFGLQFSVSAADVPADAKLAPVAAVVPVERDFSLDENASLLDGRYVKCDYNFLGRILIRNGRFHLGIQGEFVPGTGLRIESVEPNSPADQAGLAAGMLITNLNGERPDNLGSFENSFEKFDGIVKLAYKTSDDAAARDLKFDLRTHFIAAK